MDWTEFARRKRQVSQIKTPKEYIETRQGIDYPTPEYMRFIANKFFPGWGWQKHGPTTIVRDEHGKVTFALESGDLTYEGTIVGSISAAHRIQYQRNQAKELVDPGNDIKAAGTDALKKAWNQFFCICDDVYKMRGPGLNSDQTAQLRYVSAILAELKAEELEPYQQDIHLVLREEGFGINQENFNTAISKLNSLIIKHQPKEG